MPHHASWCQLIDLLSPLALCLWYWRASRVRHRLFKPTHLRKREDEVPRTMSRPPPPPTFPIPNVPRSSATGYAPPPGSVYPPQTQSKSKLFPLGVCAICGIEPQAFLASNYGINPPQQPTTYATSQLPQPPPAHRTRDPYSNNSHAPSPNSYSSSTPHPSAHLPSSELPQAPPSMPTPSVPGYGASTNFSGAPPPPMMQRVAAMPTPGQAHNPHSVPYYNVPAPVITHQPSHSGMSGGTPSVTGDWSHRACIVYNVYQNIDA